uniref:ATP-dependent Clp protease proteolytic subunit n=1 Tax=Saxegothaea conspicua TaxID=56905 RepID=A0A3S5IBX9_9CONI|nr:clp protease proteolytic subunit [Saxegothaea conspicua]BBF91280.1 ATP-dependent Clp protease proteolytic subunit [Saxegothaea conspicua]
MPLGVPKVPHQFFEGEEAAWLDLYNKLYEERLLFLAKPLDDETGNQLISMMTYLTIDDRTKDQFLFIHCTGGSIIPGIALYDTMQYITPEVHTTVIGVAASMGSLILTGGHSGTRIAFPSATVMLHQPASTYTDGMSRVCIENDDDVTMIKEQIVDIYVERTKQKDKFIIWNELDRDRFMSAEQTLQYGIVDLIINQETIHPWIRAKNTWKSIDRDKLLEITVAAQSYINVPSLDEVIPSLDEVIPSMDDVISFLLWMTLFLLWMTLFPSFYG